MLDPFSGSGTTCVCAKRLDRHYIGFEIDEEWHRISLDRLEGIDINERKAECFQTYLFD